MNLRILHKKTSSDENATNYAKSIGSLTNFTRRRCINATFEGWMNLEQGKLRHGIDMRFRCGKKSCRQNFPYTYKTLIIGCTFLLVFF